ncbi:hypothetical protein JCGZ_11086 [Jatropha curcas]|uniref:Uncharacterized protein n=1 Tax=Jatropha curcas TaxID=180498 RepID=A0A067KE74_JATCU|nr:hypothetical protein JCGZ_11086 [Jatropha curcas]
MLALTQNLTLISLFVFLKPNTTTTFPPWYNSDSSRYELSLLSGTDSGRTGAASAWRLKLTAGDDKRGNPGLGFNGIRRPPQEKKRTKARAGARSPLPSRFRPPFSENEVASGPFGDAGYDSSLPSFRSDLQRRKSEPSSSTAPALRSQAKIHQNGGTTMIGGFFAGRRGSLRPNGPMTRQMDALFEFPIKFRKKWCKSRGILARYDLSATVRCGGGPMTGWRGFKRQNDLLFAWIMELESDFRLIHSKTPFLIPDINSKFKIY